MSEPWHPQNHTLLLAFYHIDLHPLSVLLVVNIHFYHVLDWSLLVKRAIHISYIVPLSNNASTVTPSCISILSSPIFTITSLSVFLLLRLHALLFSTTLTSIANLLLLLKSNWRSSDLCPHLNYSHCSIHCYKMKVWTDFGRNSS